MGNLKIAQRPDVFTAGKASIAERQKQHGWFAETLDYARNPLAIMVARDNPKGIEGLADLGRADVRVSMPNPKWEGIARQIEARSLGRRNFGERDCAIAIGWVYRKERIVVLCKPDERRSLWMRAQSQPEDFYGPRS